MREIFFERRVQLPLCDPQEKGPPERGDHTGEPSAEQPVRPEEQRRPGIPTIRPVPRLRRTTWVSRYVLAWRLSNVLDSSSCVNVLEEALSRGPPEIFNTDQDSQFTGDDFLDVLLTTGVQP